VFFDAVGTLIHPDPPAPLVYGQVGRRFGSRLAAAAIPERFAAAFAEQEARDQLAGWRTSEEREVRRWRHIVGRVLDDVADAEGCFQELYRHFSLAKAWRADPEAAAVGAELARRGLVLGMASNYDWRLRSVAADLPAFQPFDRLVISSEVGWRKPAPEFFAALCRAAALPPEQVLFVGDDPDNDYDAARAFGVRAVLFDPRDRYVAIPDRVKRLGDVLGPLP
jgi:putative hydrolase of the HAD superfamily